MQLKVQANRFQFGKKCGAMLLQVCPLLSCGFCAVPYVSLIGCVFTIAMYRTYLGCYECTEECGPFSGDLFWLK